MSLNPKEIYARTVLLKGHVNSGDLVSIDSSLIDATLSIDTDANWIRKGNRLYYKYKARLSVDMLKKGLYLEVISPLLAPLTLLSLKGL
jgi:hypothetical protein